MGKKLRSILINLTITLVTLIIAYLIASAVMFRLSPQVAPAVMRSMPVALRVLAQSSKAGRVPQNYVAILGDSYAEGVGDWMASMARVPGSSYSAAHVLHDLSGRDVVSFGQGSASSAQSMVWLPTRALGSGGCARLTGISDPVEAFIYFYEANDISDNLGFVRNQVAVGLDDPELSSAIGRFLRDDYGRISSVACIGDFGDAIYALGRVGFETVFGAKRPSNGPWEADGSEVLIAGVPTRVTKVLPVPPVLQTPSEIAVGVDVFEQSLRWLKERLPATRLTIVYLPSPVVSYRYLGNEVTLHYRGEDVSAPVAGLFGASDATCALIRDATLRTGIRFIDSRPAIRAAAANELVHGPDDWVHFNQAGYTALGNFLFQRMGDQESDADCATPAAAMIGQLPSGAPPAP